MYMVDKKTKVFLFKYYLRHNMCDACQSITKPPAMTTSPYLQWMFQPEATVFFLEL